MIKSCLDRVFDKLGGIKNETDIKKDKINIVNNIQCPNCGVHDRKETVTVRHVTDDPN